jgi:uncharacterized protein YjdB
MQKTIKRLNFTAIILLLLLTISSCKKTSKLNVTVKSIDITLQETKIEIGKEITIVANIIPIDATNKNMTWTSSNPDIASIDKTGKIHAIKKGKTTITVTTEDGKKSDIIELSVFEKEIKVESISITIAKSTLEIGKEITIVANILPINATNKNITWNSSNPEIASIDKTGKVHAIKKGKTIISVTTEDGKKTNSYEISIKEKVILIKTISLIYNGEAIKKGDIINLTVNILPDNATDKNLKWESNTPDIASVNENGEVSFIKDGKVTITATNTDNSVKGLIELETTVEKICNIPDANFKTALINYWVSNSEKLDTNGDGEISHTEARSISHLDIWNKNISDLTGIENFVNITHLNCYKNNLINIDISKCTNIIDLRCGYNQIENIDLSNSSNLEHLNIYHNPLKSIDLTKCPKIKFLNFWQCDLLTSLDLSNCTELENLDSSCKKLESLDISKCTKLKYLECASSKIKELNTANCSKLETVNIFNSKVQSLDLSKCTELKSLIVACCGLNSLDISACTKLEKLRCAVNNLKSLDVSMCTKLNECLCNVNSITGNIYVYNKALAEKNKESFKKDDQAIWAQK